MRRRCFLLVCGATLLPYAALRAADLSVTDAWIAAPPPGARHAAGYLTVVNRGPRPRFLTATASSAATAIAVHLTEVRDGVARMRPAGPVRVESNREIRFAPGSLHLMLFIDDAPLEPGATIPLELTFDGDEVIRVAAGVRTLTAADHHAH